MSASLTRSLLACACVLATAATGCTTLEPRTERSVPVQPSVPAGPATVPGVVLLQPRPGLYTSAQPGVTDWSRLHALGVNTVINLRPAAEMAGRDERAEVRDAGLGYVSLPIAGADAITAENARALADAIASSQGKVLVHCSSGNRAGALLALAAQAQGMRPENALALGKTAGLTGLEPVVRERLGLPVAACATGDAASRC